MAQMEARQLIQDVDVLLEKDAATPRARERLNRLRAALQHVEQTGDWPVGDNDPWRHFTEAEGG